MTTRLSLLAAALMAGLAIPNVSTPAFAQQDQQQAVRDALNRAQQSAGRSAVEDLINRLRGTPAQAAPAAPGTAPAATAGAAPAPSPAPGAQPVPVPLPPATGTPAAQPASAAQSAAPAGQAVPAQPTGPAVAAPAPGLAPPAASTTTPPGNGNSSRLGGAPLVRPASTEPQVVTAIPKGGDMMAKAPEIADKMGLPQADIEVFFGFNSADITPEATNTLVVMGQALADSRLSGQRFIIGGHTDGKGRPDFNLNLSKRRAENVRKFIIEHYKIDPSRLIARGYGKSRPKDAKMPLADQNRRVQVINWTRMVASAKPAR